jgi:phage tail-like protein
VFNIHEDGSIGYGQLHRFLKILGPQLDLMKGLVDAMPTMIDVDSTDADYLEYIAYLVGVEFNREIPIPQQREEIKGAVQWYKRKGLLVGCRIHGYRISRLQTDIVEFWKNIKTSNREYSFSSDNAGSQAMNYKLPGDLTAYSYDYKNLDILTRGPEYVSSEESGHEAWRAIDDYEVTSWRASSAAPGYWAYLFDEEVLPLTFKIKAGFGLQKFRLQWSDDGVSWTDVGDPYFFGDVLDSTQFMVLANGLAQTIVLIRVPVAPDPDPVIYETDTYGTVDTELINAAENGDTQISLLDAGGLAKDDWLEIYSTAVGYGYYQVEKIEGNFITLTTPIAEQEGFPVLSQVKSISVTEKTITTDYTIDTWEGIVTLVPGQFTPGNKVFLQYTALTNKLSVDIWHTYQVNVENLSPHLYWRFYVDATWTGNPEINGIDIYPEQFFGTYYRCERLGYFFTLGNSRPGCSGQIICNNPLTEETVEKLCRTMREAVPACVEPVMTFIDCRYPEEQDLTNKAKDVSKDEIHTRDREWYDDSEDEWHDIRIDRTLFSTYPGETPIWGPPPYEDRGSPPVTTIDGEYFISLIFPP